MSLHLVAETLGQVVLASAIGIAAIGVVYALLGRFTAPAAVSPLIGPVAAVMLDAAKRRAAALAVAAVGVAAFAPRLHAANLALLDRWNAAGLGAWRHGLFALLVWLGLLPLALFIWRLPSIWAKPPVRSIAPWSDEAPLRDDRPHAESVRRACRDAALGLALGAPAGDDPNDARLSLEVVCLLPIAVALLLAATVSRWLVLGAIAAVVAWAVVVYLGTWRAALAAPGTTTADYLMLAIRAVKTRDAHAGRLAEERLDRNPALRQDHELLLAELSRAARLDPPSWNPAGTDAAEIIAPIRLRLADQFGREHDVALTVQLRRRADGWRIARLAMDEPGGARPPATAARFASAAAWRPR